MPILKHQIAKRVKGSMAEKEDWWHACYDTDTKEFFIEHSWDHVQINGLSQDAGSSRHSIDDWNGEGRDNIPAAKEQLLAEAQS
jgi:hypothetical protein